MGTQIWLQNLEPKTWDVLGEMEGRDEGSLAGTEDKPLSGGHRQRNK